MAVRDHFKARFCLPSDPRPSLLGLEAANGPDLGCLSSTEAVALELPVTETEIWEAVKNCAGRNILDGALIANETLDYLKKKHDKSLIFKVDFEKAFDCLSWDFLMEVMEHMGFGEKWRRWILSCLKSASISILVNGSPTDEFMLGRGVRQGDPLSPFLFIITAEGLNLLTKKAVQNGLFSGVEVGCDNVLISHLQYADDTIFFGSWSEGNMLNLMKILKCFELTSGLKVNYHKSIVYGVGVGKSEILGSGGGKNFKKLAEWKARAISSGGRVTLVKSVLNSIPLYYFSLFRAPPCVLKKLKSVRRSFFWGGLGSGAKIPWVKWDEILLPYDLGGLNLGTLNCKNFALIGKWSWRFHTEANSLWVKVIKSIYGSSGGLTSCTNNHIVSYSSAWYNIIKTCCFIDSIGVPFVSSFFKEVGNGATTSFWNDKWLGDFSLRDRFKRLVRFESNLDVSVCDRTSCMGSNRVGCWGWSRVPFGCALGELDELNHLLSSHVSKGDGPDAWRWGGSTSGRFTTNILSELITTKLLHSDTNVFETLRNNLVPKKVEVFVWRARKRQLPVLTELDKRGIDLHSTRCPLCDDSVESVEHSLILCKLAFDIWSKVLVWWGMGGSPNLSLGEMFQGKASLCMSEDGTRIWKWEITGIPCKHEVVVINNMVENGLEVGEQETSLWEKDEYLYTLVAPKKISTPDRPKNKRRMSSNEKDVVGVDGKLSTQGKLKKCGACETYGHNKNRCTTGASTSVLEVK
ncbi:uncharacterized protein [Rutidosis leptorrhynchoides]|uniref:uncharacterized protein n=1 Tax=Rutidosis leptorrhynchoides TaxID=125765 RepID=UPI003A990F72